MQSTASKLKEIVKSALDIVEKADRFDDDEIDTVAEYIRARYQPEPIPKQDAGLIAYLEGQGYFNIRVLNDGIVCNFHMLFTTAVIINPNWSSYERRICYPKSSALAEKMCLNMTSVDDEPLPGYTALK